MDILAPTPIELMEKHADLADSLYPFLKSYLLMIRNMKGVKNKSDRENQQKALAQELMFICKSNYPLFLIITGRFREYRRYFSKLGLFYERRNFINLIEKEHNYARKHGQLQAIPSWKPLESMASDPGWKQRSQMLSNMQLYYYYDNEIKKVTHKYHEHQYNLINHYFNLRINRIQNLLDHVDGPIYAQLSQNLEIMRKECTKKHNEIMKEPNLETRHFLLKNMDEQFIIELQAALKKYAPYDETVNSALQTDIKESNDLKMELKKNELKFIEKIKELNQHKEVVWKHSVQEIHQSFDGLLDYIQNNGRKNLTKEQNDIFSEHLSRLRGYQEELNRVKDPESANKILDNSKKVVSELDELVKSAANKECSPQWNEEISEFKKLSYKMGASKIENKSPEKENDRESAVKKNAFLKKHENENLIDKAEVKPDLEIKLDSGINYELIVTDEFKEKSDINLKKETINNIASESTTTKSSEAMSFDEEQKSRKFFDKLSNYIKTNYFEKDDFINKETINLVNHLQKEIEKIRKEIDADEFDSANSQSIYEHLKELRELKGDDKKLKGLIGEMNSTFQFNPRISSCFSM